MSISHMNSETGIYFCKLEPRIPFQQKFQRVNWKTKFQLPHFPDWNLLLQG